MGSGVVLAIIAGIWAVFLLPMFLRKHDPSGKLQDVEKFRDAMGHLGSGLNIPQQPKHPRIESKREIRVGQPDPQIKLQVKKRRKIFLAINLTSLIFIVTTILGIMPIASMAIPFLLFASFIAWVRLTLKPRVVDAIDENAPYQKYVRRSERHHRFAALAQLRKAATLRLTEVEAEIDTAKTTSWQPSPAMSGGEIETPQSVLPSFVGSPAATEVPRVIDRENGNWDADAMLQAAARQRREELAKLVADENIDTVITTSQDDEGTTELPRVIGA